ncbi:NAD(P)-dependent oxidoreductase [Sporosarcina sp. ACRSL]|uniref:NAD(P)-dependent oxidoreductase n=1 Tax=Sporosarcina sp. ACRSL TaxID=2918215 RepID=UPI001EF4EA46|nr:NAD(P)-dependent oxidoreductase [Sporosarcina sp. ACRSL]MCG7346463.1 NAD(P)-dependent oxidoreductase [Sporosarcina sp. ACRSL]
MKIRMIGCGAMGAGMVKNLLKHGYDVSTYDPDPSKQEQMKKLGAAPVSSSSYGLSEIDVVLLSLPTSALVEETLIGDKGILQHLKKGSLILDMSTTDVRVTKQLAQSAAEKSVHFLDCPVSNGPAGANDGTLTIMVGGEEHTFHSVLPVLESIGKEIRYIGPSGSGQVVKLCNNMMVAGITVLLSETFVAGAKNGVDPMKIAELMSIGSAQNKVLSVFGPNLLNDTHHDVKFFLSHMAKDVNLYMDMTKSTQSPALLGSIVEQLYEAAKLQGKGHLDSSAVGQVVEWMGNYKICN